MPGKRPELEMVRRAAHKATHARMALETAICHASAEGHSLRVIASEAGLSHEQIRRVVSPSKATTASTTTTTTDA